MAGGCRSHSVCLRMEGEEAAGGGYLCVAGGGWLSFTFSVFVYGGRAAGWVFMCGGWLALAFSVFVGGAAGGGYFCVRGSTVKIQYVFR